MILFSLNSIYFRILFALFHIIPNQHDQFGLILLHKSEGKSAYYTVAAVLSVLALVSAMDITTDTLFHKAPMDISEYTFKESNNTGDASAGEYVLCDENTDFSAFSQIFQIDG